jgi:NADP-dependent 3-hydroxy acid dehydrogenase YdfG
MKTVIVTGATGNLGQVVCKKFLDEGWLVIGTTTSKTSSKEMYTVDLTKEDEAGTFIQQVISKHQQIDAAVLTVGGFAAGKIADTDMQAIMQMFTLNFQTAYHIARLVFMQMMKQGYGRIFLTGARPGIDMKNSKGLTAYGLSKSLIFRLAELMNEEAKGQDVVTSVIAPSTIDTPENRKSMPDADTSKWVKPSDIADIIYFYCTQPAGVLREPVIKVYNKA